VADRQKGYELGPSSKRNIFCNQPYCFSRSDWRSTWTVARRDEGPAAQGGV